LHDLIEKQERYGREEVGNGVGDVFIHA